MRLVSQFRMEWATVHSTTAHGFEVKKAETQQPRLKGPGVFFLLGVGKQRMGFALTDERKFEPVLVGNRLITGKDFRAVKVRTPTRMRDAELPAIRRDQDLRKTLTEIALVEN